MVPADENRGARFHPRESPKLNYNKETILPELLRQPRIRPLEHVSIMVFVVVARTAHQVFGLEATVRYLWPPKTGSTEYRNPSDVDDIVP